MALASRSSIVCYFVYKQNDGKLRNHEGALQSGLLRILQNVKQAFQSRETVARILTPSLSNVTT